MPTPTDYVKKGTLRVIEPAISLLARNNVSPNKITTAGTLVTVAAGAVYASGHIMTAGWIMAVTAFFHVIYGGVGRRNRRCPGVWAFFQPSPHRVGGGGLVWGPPPFFSDKTLPPK